MSKILPWYRFPGICITLVLVCVCSRSTLGIGVIGIDITMVLVLPWYRVHGIYVTVVFSHGILPWYGFGDYHGTSVLSLT